MEGGVAAKEGQEKFETGVGEIHSMPSSTPQIAVCARCLSQGQKEVKSSASRDYTCLHHSPGVAKQGGNMAAYGRMSFANNPFVWELQSSGNNESDDRPANPDELNLPDDQSLTSALEKLSIDHSISGEPTLQSSAQYYKLSHVHGLQSLGQYHHLANKFSPLDSADMSLLPTPNPLDVLNMANLTSQTYAPRTMNGMDKFNIQVNCQADEAPNFNTHEPQGQKLESLSDGFRELWHRASMYTGDASFISGMDSSQFVPGEFFPGLEGQSSTFQQQYWLKKPPAYKQPQDLSYPHIAWDDSYSMMPRKHFYLQQLQSQEVHQLQNGENSISRCLAGSPVPSLYSVPISHQIEQLKQDDYWRRCALEQGESQHDLALMGHGSGGCYAQGYCGKENLTFAFAKRQTNGSGVRYSGRDFRGVPAFNKGGKVTFPEKILTRSKGSKLLRISETGASISNELVSHAGFKQRASPNGQLHPLVQTSASFQVDGGNSKAISSYNSCNRLTSSPRSSQPKYECDYGSLDDISGRIYSLSRDQTGCRFLQEALKNCAPQDVHKIFVEITSHIVELTTDPFGNYLLQKLVEVCNEEQKMCIIQEITSKAGELIRISCDMHGTRVIQKVIEAVKTPEQVSMIVSSLKPGILQLIKDTNGSHVVQYCLQHLSPEFTKFMLEAAISHSVELAKDRQGCVVLQKCLPHLDVQQRERLMSDISSNALVLSQHQFGNYMVQYLLELRVPSATEDVLNKLEGNFADLSVQKYSSNVVEKCLKYSSEGQHFHIIRELINNFQLVHILQDPYGNYVIQSAIRSCKGPLYDALVEAIRPHIPAIQSSPYAKKVLSTLSRKKQFFS